MRLVRIRKLGKSGLICFLGQKEVKTRYPEMP
jgi:hypothetical protein